MGRVTPRGSWGPSREGAKKTPALWRGKKRMLSPAVQGGGENIPSTQEGRESSVRGRRKGAPSKRSSIHRKEVLPCSTKKREKRVKGGGRERSITIGKKKCPIFL